jgi:hypothetical protein
MSFSQSSSSSFDDHAFSSSPPRVQSSESFAALSSPRSSSPAADSPAGDGPWDEAWWARFPGHIMATKSGERSCWWQHGYRLLQVDDSLPSASRHVWVCKICVAKRRPPPTAYYKFIASIGRSVIRHLQDHRITRGRIGHREGRNYQAGSQSLMAQYLHANVSNP